MAYRYFNKGFSLTEILVIFTIFIVVTTALYLMLSNYSSSFLRIDDKLENLSDGWRVVQAIQEDLLSLDVPDGDLNRWIEAIKENGDDLILTCRMNGNTSNVIYTFNRSEHSLVRKALGKTRVLVARRCHEFKVQPEWKQADSQKPPTEVILTFRLKLTPPPDPRFKTFEPLIIETSISPEFLNRRLKATYFHTGLPNELKSDKN